MNSNIVIDCHADTLLKQYLGPLTLTFSENLMQQENHVTKELLDKGGVDIQVFAIFVPPKLEKLGVEITLEMIALAKEMEKVGFFLIKSKNELAKVKQIKNSTGMVLSMEGTVAFERNLNLLPIFYELGIRNIGLSWSRSNLFCEGTGLYDSMNESRGLTCQGRALVEEMEKLGIIIDISHLNEKGVADVTNITSKPFIASHSNAYNLCPVSRNLKDNQLEEIASANGVIGINFYPRFLSQNPEKVSINNVIEHIIYIAELIGIDHVGLGSDFDGITITPKGLENAGKIKNIPPLLEKNGFSKTEISKIMGCNFQRVFTEVWK